MMNLVYPFVGFGFGPFPIVLITAMCLWVLIAGWFQSPALDGTSCTTQLKEALHLSAVVVSGALLAWALPTTAISLATGREVFMRSASTMVEAEPLPNARAPDGLRRAEMDLEILYETRLTGLKHSLYDASEVRDRIGIWLREHAGVTTDTQEAEEDSGR